MFKIGYVLDDAGWADVEFEHEGKVVQSAASHLWDSLADLAKLAILAIDVDEQYLSDAFALFLAEPGGLRLSLRLAEEDVTWDETDTVHLVVERFEDEITPRDFPTEVVLRAEVCRRDFAEMILEILDTLLADHGLKGYNRRWHMSPFPLDWHATLAGMLGREVMTVPISARS